MFLEHYKNNKKKKTIPLDCSHEHVSAAVMESWEITVFAKAPKLLVQNFLDVLFTSIRVNLFVSNAHFLYPLKTSDGFLMG